jgi:tRNA dimethylallyltransferase
MPAGTFDTFDTKPILAIVGPTGVGKTAVAVKVAEAASAEIISADSMAVYRGMDIGTAKPTPAERARVPFHVIDVAEPDEEFNVSRFKSLADRAAEGIAARGKRIIVSGGTGLYVRAFLDNLSLTETPPDSSIRERLDAEAREFGAPRLHARLTVVDPGAAARIHPNDRVRIVRALEVYERTGVPISAQQAEDQRNRVSRRAVRIALTAPREVLFRRIEERVEQMITEGLVEEVQGLLAKGYPDASPAYTSLGYKEIVAYLEGKSSLDDAKEEISRNTRRLAKRQWTWFRADRELTWIDISGKTTAEIAQEIRRLWPT